MNIIKTEDDQGHPDPIRMDAFEAVSPETRDPGMAMVDGVQAEEKAFGYHFNGFHCAEAEGLSPWVSCSGGRNREPTGARPANH
jgi:hypothetical protein